MLDRGFILACMDKLGNPNSGKLKNANKLRNTNYTVEDLYLFDNPKTRCVVCNGDVQFYTYNFGYKEHCGASCAQKNKRTRSKIRKTMLENHGVTSTFQLDNCKQTILKRYGVRNVMQNIDIKTKRIQTSINIYGVEYPTQTAQVKITTKETNLAKYGTICPLQNQTVQSLSQETLLDNYGVNTPFQSEEIKNKIRQTHEASGAWIREENISDWELYKKRVWQVTKNEDTSQLDNIENRGHMKNNSMAWHLDHKFSIYEGFQQSIPPIYIGRLHNLEMIPARDNIKKKNKCSISLNELYKPSNFNGK